MPNQLLNKTDTELINIYFLLDLFHLATKKASYS